MYRESYDLYAVQGWLFNHEGVRRGIDFVTRKITLGLSKIIYGLENCLSLGNLSALRDWGHAKDYVEAQWLMLQQKKPEDFVIATGTQHSVRTFCSLAFEVVGINLKWEGDGVKEKGVCAATGMVYVQVDPKYFRPVEVETLLGDPTKAKKVLGWNPSDTSFEELIKIMVL